MGSDVADKDLEKKARKRAARQRKKEATQELRKQHAARRELQELDVELGRPHPMIPDAGKLPKKQRSLSEPRLSKVDLALRTSWSKLDGDVPRGVDAIARGGIGYGPKRKR